MLNEVGVGPLSSYVEVFNGSSVPVDLRPFRVESSQGTFALGGLAAPLPPGAHALLMGGRPDEVGVSDDPDVPVVLVSGPVTAVDTDTILLGLDGRVVDALCYGIQQDASPRYARAVDAGQLAAGTFVDLGQAYTEATLGRDASGTDTDRTADWTLHGGVDAVWGTPLAPNRVFPGGREFSVETFQQLLNQLVMGCYYQMDVLAASHGGYAGTDDRSSAVHTFVVSSPDLGVHVTLSGSVDFAAELLGDGAYRLTFDGVLTDALGRSLALDLEQTVEPWRTLTTLDACLDDGRGVHPYWERNELRVFGQRGAYDVDVLRDNVGWSGNRRTTLASSSHAWELAGGRVRGIDTAATMTRTWPITDRPLASGDPADPFTMEDVSFRVRVDPTPDGYLARVEDYVADYGTQGASTWSDFEVSLEVLPGTGTFRGGLSADVDFESPTRISLDTDLVVSGDGKTVLAVTDCTQDGTLRRRLHSAVDPPAASAPGSRWQRFKQGLRSLVASGTRYAMTGVAGAGCGLATTFTAGATGLATCTSLGAATPTMIFGTGAVAGACAALTAGTFEVLAPLSEV